MSQWGSDNPVGLLNERYQTLGLVMPEYQVAMVHGQAHAPVFRANLTVAEGILVTASGNSKKMARNQAAVLMLDRLRDEDLDLRGGKEVVRSSGVKGSHGRGKSGFPSDRPSVQSRLVKKAELTPACRDPQGSSKGKGAAVSSTPAPFVAMGRGKPAALAQGDLRKKLEELRAGKKTPARAADSESVVVEMAELRVSVGSLGQRRVARVSLEEADITRTSVYRSSNWTDLRQAAIRKSEGETEARSGLGPPSLRGGQAGCVCLRPLKLVLCQLCGETFPARKRQLCSSHPTDLYLLDIRACVACRQPDLDKLVEYPLPTGMEETLAKRNFLLKMNRE